MSNLPKDKNVQTENKVGNFFWLWNEKSCRLKQSLWKEEKVWKGQEKTFFTIQQVLHLAPLYSKIGKRSELLGKGYINRLILIMNQILGILLGIGNKTSL